MPAQITFYRLRPCRSCDNIHRPKRTRNHAAFTADTMRLFNEDMPMFTTNSVRWAHVSTGSIFALMTGNCRRKGVVFNNPNPRDKRPGGDRCAILIFLMCDNAGNFAGTTPNTFCRIRHNKRVHCPLRLS
jgi:hypothetical protein